MKNRSTLVTILTISIVAISVYYLSSRVKEPANQQVVAITRIIPHPSLEQIRLGILDELKAQNLNPKIIFEDAQGSIATAAQIATKFVSLNPTVIVPITTPSALTVYSAAKDKNIPVVFTAVNDPVSTKLVPSLTQPGRNITGLADLPPLAEQVAFIRKTFPEIKRVGMIYNPGEANSVVVRVKMEALLAKEGITLLEAPAPTTASVAPAAQSLVSKVDLIYLSNDNSIVSALDSIIKVTRAAGVPVMTSDPESMERGATASVAHDQYEIGRQAGRMVADVLRGKPISEIPPQVPTKVVTKYNPTPLIN